MTKDIPLSEGLPVTAIGGVDPRSMNAVRHGLTARRVLESEAEAYKAAFDALQRECGCTKVVELALLRRVAHLIVRLDRAALIDALSFAECFEDAPSTGSGQGEGPRRNPESAADAPQTSAAFSHLRFDHLLATVARYELELGRALAKAQHELERLVGAGPGVPEAPAHIVDFNW